MTFTIYSQQEQDVCIGTFNNLTLLEEAGFILEDGLVSFLELNKIPPLVIENRDTKERFDVKYYGWQSASLGGKPVFLGKMQVITCINGTLVKT